MDGDEQEEEVEALHLGSITITQWLETSTGERSYSVACDGSLPVSDYLGLLVIGQHELLAEMVETREAGDDD